MLKIGRLSSLLLLGAVASMCDTISLRKGVEKYGIVTFQDGHFMIQEEGQQELSFGRSDVSKVRLQTNRKPPPDPIPRIDVYGQNPGSDRSGQRSYPKTPPIFENKADSELVCVGDKTGGKGVKKISTEAADTSELDKLVKKSGDAVFGRLECIDKKSVKLEGQKLIDRRTVDYLVVHE